MLTTFTLDCGDLKISQRNVGSTTTPATRISGDLHKLTPEQFDALTQAFTVTEATKILTTDGRYGPTRTFRTSTIDFGGLMVRLFADVPENMVDPNQLALDEGFVPTEN